MNRRLLDPFQSVELPEIIEEYLDHGTATCMAFNRRGTLLASGTKEGQIVIWDFDTRGVAAVLSGHEGPVTSVAWSRNGRLLLSGSEDRRVILWNVLAGTPVAVVPLPSAVVKVSLTPRPPHLGVVSLAEGLPVVVDFTGGSGGAGGEGQGELGQQRPLVAPLPVAGDGAELAAGRGGGAGNSGNSAGGGVAVFSRGGEVIIGAHLRNALCVVDTASRRILDVVRVPARVSDLALNRKGTLLLATCADQRVRMFEVALPTRGLEPSAQQGQEQGQQGQAPSEAQLAEALASKAVKSGSLLHGPEGGLLRPARDFQNAVERTPWRCAAFSTDSEHVVGALGSRNQMQLFIWNRPLGNMERILEGPKEGALELVWHPLRSLLLCCATSGRIYIWAKVHAENWSAFAPDFKELDENTEYVEREDEFDWNTPGAGGELGPAGGAAEGDGEGEAAPLDILTREPLQAFSSDEEEEGAGPGGAASELLYLQVVVEPEMLPAAREEGDGTEAEGEGEEQQQQQKQQLQQQQRQAGGQQPMLMAGMGGVQLQTDRTLASFPRRGATPVNGAEAGPHGGEAAWGLQQGQQWPADAAAARAAAGWEAGGGERRRGGLEAAEELGDGGGGQQQGRKRKVVQFEEGAMEALRGR